MLNDKLVALETLFHNKTFAEKFSSLDDFAQMKELFSSYGLSLTDEELKEFLDAAITFMENDNELSIEELENVSGGFGIAACACVCVTCAIICGISAYNLRKAKNSIERKCSK